MEPNYFPCLGHAIVEAECQAALFGGHMWSGYKDHTTPFQSRTATGNETPRQEQGLLKNKYNGRIHVYFKYEFDRAGIMYMSCSDFRILHTKSGAAIRYV